MGSIRGDFCLAMGPNLRHKSDAIEFTEEEIKPWFPDGVREWDPGTNARVYKG